MKKIYIILTKSNTFISNFINLVTSDRYTHASISFNEDLQPMYSFARKYVNSPLPAGLRIEPLHEGFFLKHRNIPCCLYALEVSDEIYEKAKQDVEKMMEIADKYRFSVLGLILCKFNIPYHRENLYFCSEFVGKVLQDSNAMDLPKVPSLMRPNDYTALSDLSCLYEGRLGEMLEERNILQA